MIVSGTVMKVRDSSFVDQKTKAQISMLYLDVFDSTAGLLNLSCRLDAVSVRPEVKQEITAEVSGLRRTNFGAGVNVSVVNLHVNGAGGPPLPPRAK